MALRMGQLEFMTCIQQGFWNACGYKPFMFEDFIHVLIFPQAPCFIFQLILCFSNLVISLHIHLYALLFSLPQISATYHKKSVYGIYWGPPCGMWIFYFTVYVYNYRSLFSEVNIYKSLELISMREW